MSNLRAVSSENVSLKKCIDYANDVIQLCGLHVPRVSSIQDFNSSLFVSLFEHVTDHKVLDLRPDKDSFNEAHNIQAVIDTISLYLFNVSLPHITGEEIVSDNLSCIFDLLEVLRAIYDNCKKEESYDVPLSVESSVLYTTYDHIKEAVKSSSEDEENVSSARVLTRKMHRNTLNKHSHHISKKQEDHAVPYHSQRKTDVPENLKPLLKRKNSKPVETVYKRSNTESIEDLYQSNLEKKVKALLLKNKSPVIRPGEMRRKYIQSLKAPLKKKVISPCKKSFLLPHDLRTKSKSPVRQHLIRKKASSEKQIVKSQSDKNIRTQTESNVQNGETANAIQSMLKEFPGFQFPDNTLERLKKTYLQHMKLMHKQLRNTLLQKPTVVKQTEEAMKEEAKLSKILTKDLREKDNLRKINEQKAMERTIKASLRDARMQSVKMRQYFEEFHKSMSRRLGKRNFSEEVLIEKTFKEMLDLQKENVRLLCKSVKEARDYDGVEHRKYLDALKNVYKDQLDLLTESIEHEQKELFERINAKQLADDKMSREIVKQMLNELRSLQKYVLDMMEDLHFRELDAQNFIRNYQL